MTTTAALTGLTLFLAACGVPGDPPDDDPPAGAQAGSPEAAPEDDATNGPADPTPSRDGSDRGTDHPALGDSCVNEVDGYRLAYPDGWDTNSGEVTAPCQVFDLSTPELQPDTHAPLDAAVLVTVEDRALDEVRAQIERDPATDVNDVVDIELAGREALRVDGTATGEAYLDAGVEVHRSYVAFDERTLTASANSLGEPDLDQRREIIAQMLTTLEHVDEVER